MSVAATHTHDVRPWRLPRFWFVHRPLALRTLLVLACLVAVAVAAAVGRPEQFAGELPLARLLRGMALIKGGIVLAAVAVLQWRFSHPIAPLFASVYIAGISLATGAAILIWQLTLIPLAAVLFHVAELGLLLAAWRDGLNSTARP